MTPILSVALPVVTLVQREMIRFLRQRTRVVGALATPILFWLILGSGIGASFHEASGTSDGYLNYFFPGTLAMILLFTSIFSTISIIEDRKEGFLQSVLAAPIPRYSIVAGKVLGSVALALLQGTLLLFISPWVGYELTGLGLLLSISQMTVIAFAMTTMGFYFAWSIDSIQGFHAIMNLLLFPMWLLSGATFPVESAPPWLRTLMYINPLTYGLSSLRFALGARSAHSTFIVNFAIPSALMLSFGVIFYILSIKRLKKGF